MAATVVDSTVRISFGLVHGLLLAMLFPLFYVFIPAYVKQNPGLTLFVLLPLISYLWGFGLNSLSQYINCRKISLSQISLVSLLSPLFVVVFSGLAYGLPFLRSPVESILPISADDDMRYALGFSFYLMWAGIYGQNIASGMVQSCPGAAGPK